MQMNDTESHRPMTRLFIDEETGYSDQHGVPVKLERKRTKLVKPERSNTLIRKPVVNIAASNGGMVANSGSGSADETSMTFDPWFCYVYLITFWAIPAIMSQCGMKDRETQRAWREKIALIFLILCCCAVLAFLTFGMQSSLCKQLNNRASFDQPPLPNAWAVNGMWYNIPTVTMQQWHPSTNLNQPGTQQVGGLFLNSVPTPHCDALGIQFQSTACTENGVSYCHTMKIDTIAQYTTNIQVSYEWNNITEPGSTYIIYDGIVLDATSYLVNGDPFLGQEMDTIIRSYVGQDITRKIQHQQETINQMMCFVDIYQVGVLGQGSSGCFAADILNYIALVVILGLVFTRFLMALTFQWIVAPGLVKPSDDPAPFYALSGSNSTKFMGKQAFYQLDNGLRKKNFLPITSRFSANNRSNGSIEDAKSAVVSSEEFHKVNSNFDISLPHVIMLVTCYSEGEQEIKNTLESLASTQYNDRNKMFFIVADGMVQTGDGRFTPDVCASLLELETDSVDPELKAYAAVAEGYKQNNAAKVYSGYFRYKEHRVPAILVAKCGTELEKSERKPGNRGKRDSQVILMSFLSKVMFDDRMTPLEYDLFTKITRICGVTPDYFEHVLMIDADTKVMPNALSLLINAMKNDVTIMGLCGETRIDNKSQSWVTAIQVYEYYVSHHLAKAFESMFGGVTCLPGCFALYRIKAPKYNDGYWVPILANPDVVEIYSNNVVDTLHKKNLFSLGEDRFLTTLMLKTFPKRKMMFVPQAICKTEVPDKFSVLLSQRRRWINSTVHNLMELVLVKDLCGTFCFSMQMVVALELFGTVVLPAAIIFTGFLIYSIIVPAQSFIDSSVIPLIMLVSILMLPGFLVLLTAHNPSYILWMFIYLFALPVWNFVLPVYAFWHFDDFGWGKTRAIAGDLGNDGHTKAEGRFDSSSLVMKRWHEWEKEKLRLNGGDDVSDRPSSSYNSSTTTLVAVNSNDKGLEIPFVLQEDVPRARGTVIERDLASRKSVITVGERPMSRPPSVRPDFLSHVQKSFEGRDNAPKARGTVIERGTDDRRSNRWSNNSLLTVIDSGPRTRPPTVRPDFLDSLNLKK